MTESTQAAAVRCAILSFAHGHANGYAGVLTRLSDAELVVIADEDEERGRDAAERFGTEFTADYREVLAREDIDAVVICSENARHAEMTIASAEAGKHVLCEKPLATTMDDAQAMIDACAKAGVKLQTAFPVRFNAATVAFRDAIREGRVGTPLAVIARNPGTCPMDWFVDPDLAGGGAVMDHTVHVIDVLRHIFDAEVTEVFAEADTRIYDIPVDDVGLVMFRMSNGLRGSLDTSWSRPKNWPIWGGVEIEVIGDKGALKLDAFNDNLEIAEIEGPSYRWQAVEHSGDPEMVAAFIHAVKHDEPVKVTGEDGMRAMQVALAAYESVRSHEPVEVVTG
ncbi:MAG TPA: Gfo/Idh/MocA family oxidoreductase [Thermomicrobiales bacterium]|nr:Gfo/Idh/MocA family oxidoreductase [Thermomicrobiales bacterium]